VRWARVDGAGPFGAAQYERYGLIVYEYAGAAPRAVRTARAKSCRCCMNWLVHDRNAGGCPCIRDIRSWPMHPAATLWFYGLLPAILLLSLAQCAGQEFPHLHSLPIQGESIMKSLARVAVVAAWMSVAATAAPQVQTFEAETVGAEPKSFSAAGRQLGRRGRKRQQAPVGQRQQVGQRPDLRGPRRQGARALRRALRRVPRQRQTYAYYPIAVMNACPDFREGSISVRFKGVAGRIDQAAGILFNVQPNGDYLALRANPLEDNLVLWQYEKGRRSSVKWMRNTPTPTGQWHELKLVGAGKQVEGWINGKRYCNMTCRKQFRAASACGPRPTAWCTSTTTGWNHWCADRERWRTDT
jgi:hypothetical protein